MISDDFPGTTMSIGELAERAGATVKTVRFYSDRGLLPEAGRSGGGHRRYLPEALERLRLIRSLRSLGLSVPEVGRALDHDDALTDVVADGLRALEGQLTALRWRNAALQVLQDCTAAERVERLRLLGSLATPPSTDSMARFWRYLLPARLPARLVSAVLEAVVPQPPADPAPAQVLAFARLHSLTAEARPDLWHPDTHLPDGGEPTVLYEGLFEAFALSSAALAQRLPPQAGAALDRFVAAYAESFGARDTPAFRRKLGVRLADAASAGPQVDRYWQLAAELSPNPTVGAAQSWLRAALLCE